jgi:hypothetical protein
MHFNMRFDKTPTEPALAFGFLTNPKVLEAEFHVDLTYVAGSQLWHPSR